jgi:hypothetical protein
MIQVEPIINFGGFGTGQQAGEYFHSQGMMRSENGIKPAWSIASRKDSSEIAALGLINAFAQGKDGSTLYPFAVDASGDIFLKYVTGWLKLYTPGQTTYGNGLIVDQKNRVLYPMSRYLGKYDPTTNYTTGTVTTTNGSAVITGSGTNWTAGMVGKLFRVNTENVFYTIQSVDSTTQITLTSNYGQATGGGQAYTIYNGFDDTWQDFGASSLPSDSDYRQPDTYEDWVLFPNGNKVAGVNTSDDSFNSNLFNFPNKFLVRSISSNSNGVLLGANFNNIGVIALWAPGYTRSIAPWMYLNAPIQAIIKENGTWIVITGREIFRTDGYTPKTLTHPIDTEVDAQGFNTFPQGGVVIRNRLIYNNDFAGLNRRKPGTYILDLTTGMHEFVAVSNGCLRGVTMGGMFFDSNFDIHLGYATSKPNRSYIGVLQNNAPAKAVYISPRLGRGATDKTAEGVKLNLGFDQLGVDSNPITFNVTVKVYNFRRPLWTYANVKTLQAVANQIVVDGTVSGVSNAQIGDEITVLDGVNAGEIRHITNIGGQNTSTETWTLDENLSNMTEAAAVLNVSPFQKVSKQTITDVTELRDLYFNVKNKIKGKNYLIKVVIDNMGNTAIPELQESFFVYDDLGIL